MPTFPPGTLEAVGLYLVRTSAMLLSTPVFTMGTGFSSYKVALIAMLAGLLYSVTGEPVVGSLDSLTYGAMALREVLIGLSIGFVLQLFLVAVKVAGQMVGHEMGFMMARQIDPETGVQVPLITRIWEDVFLIGMLSVNGHHLFLRALADSFRRAPVADVRIGGGVTELMQGLFGSMFAAGLSFAAPILVLLLLVSILIGILTRAVPYLNVIEMSFTLRVTLGLFALFFFAPLLEPVLERLYADLGSWLDRTVAAVAGA
jgi:flagellar biosynthetic protein FliR